MKKLIKSPYLKLHLSLFSTVVIGAVTNHYFSLFTIKQIVLFFYLPLFIFLLFMQLILILVPSLRLYIYYYISIKFIFSKLLKISRLSNLFILKKLSAWILNRAYNAYYTEYILNSFPIKIPKNMNNKFSHGIYSDDSMESTISNRPTFIKREHLECKRFWKFWAFTSVIVFNKLDNKIRIKSFLEKGDRKYRLEIDLRNHSYGIYNNGGKKYLYNKFMTPPYEQKALQLSERIQDFLLDSNPINEVLDIQNNTVFRWASGGVLPIARWKNRKWFALFFRDIKPTGWNIPNGASESKDEYKDVNTLIYREFAEELVILNQKPDISDYTEVSQKLFRWPFGIPGHGTHLADLSSFVDRHIKVRQDEDKLFINKTDGPIIEPMKTPFKLKLMYHDKTLNGPEIKRIDNIIFIINPTEFGIEIIRPIEFDLAPDDYLIDGEIWEVGPTLIRQPVMLISCEYLKSIYNNNTFANFCLTWECHKAILQMFLKRLNNKKSTLQNMGRF